MSMVKSERILQGFTSLFSSALTANEEGLMEPIQGNSSTLPRLLSRSVHDHQTCCMLPTLMLKHPDGNNETHEGSSSLVDQAALNLARPLALTRMELEAAPIALLANVSQTFSELIDSRLRSSLGALISNAQHQRDPTLTRVLVGLLAVSNNPIRQTTVVTSFRLLNTADATSDGGLVMPLVMETTVDLKIFSELVTVKIVAPGTIQGAFGNRDLGITKAEIVLDTISFLQSMMREARFAVRKAVALSSTIATRLLGQSSNNESLPPKRILSTASLKDSLQQKSSIQPSSSLSNIRSSSVSALMPPPPSRPSRQSMKDLLQPGATDKSAVLSENAKNASWASLGSPSTTAEATKQKHPGGLSLLAQALGLHNDAASGTRTISGFQSGSSLPDMVKKRKSEEKDETYCDESSSDNVKIKQAKIAPSMN